MDSRLNIKYLKALCLGIMSIMLVGCQDTLPKRALIDDSSQTTGGTTGGGGGDTPAVRPDKAIQFKPNFCGCKDRKAITYGNCSTFCSTKDTNGFGYLYADFNVTEDISLNSLFGSVKGWCTTTLPDQSGTGKNAKCLVAAKDDDGTTIPLDVQDGSTPNSLKIPIDALSEDKAYILTLYEESSGSKSDSIQIIKFSADISLPTLGPLKNAPISQYSCIHRPPSVDEENGDIYYDAAFRVHFYFLPRVGVNPIPGGSDIVCHDFMSLGMIDESVFTRIEQIEGIFIQ